MVGISLHITFVMSAKLRLTFVMSAKLRLIYVMPAIACPTHVMLTRNFDVQREAKLGSSLLEGLRIPKAEPLVALRRARARKIPLRPRAQEWVNLRRRRKEGEPSRRLQSLWGSP